VKGGDKVTENLNAVGRAVGSGVDSAEWHAHYYYYYYQGIALGLDHRVRAGTLIALPPPFLYCRGISPGLHHRARAGMLTSLS
jgi:hypothetical protein